MMFLLLMIYLFSGQVHVQTKDMDSDGNNRQFRKIDIVASNATGSDISLDSVSLKYYFIDTLSDLNLSLWYFQIHDTTWQYSPQGVDLVEPELTSVNDSLIALALTFKQGYVLPNNGVMEVQLGINRLDWSVIDQSSDPSYIATTTFADNASVSFLQTSKFIYQCRVPVGIYGTRLPCCTTTY